MHTVDIVVACVAALLIVIFASILARQRYMLRLDGAVRMAIQRGNRWLYGIARYQGSELRWYRGIGIGTRPSRVLRRGAVQVLGRRPPTRAEWRVLEPNVTVITCRVDGETFAAALDEGAYTGFVSWLESSAPHS